MNYLVRSFFAPVIFLAFLALTGPSTAIAQDEVVPCNPNTFGDVNEDGEIGFADFLIMSFYFGQEVESHRQGDVDCSGDVAFADFLVQSSCFGGCGVGGGFFAQPVDNVEAVPEPAFTPLTLLLVLGCLGRCRSRSRV